MAGWGGLVWAKGLSRDVTKLHNFDFNSFFDSQAPILLRCRLLTVGCHFEAEWGRDCAC